MDSSVASTWMSPFIWWLALFQSFLSYFLHTLGYSIPRSIKTIRLCLHSFCCIDPLTLQVATMGLLNVHWIQGRNEAVGVIEHLPMVVLILPVCLSSGYLPRGNRLSVRGHISARIYISTRGMYNQDHVPPREITARTLLPQTHPHTCVCPSFPLSPWL